MGLYGLGAKKSGEYYSREDTDLLETVARQAGVALQNAHFHKQLADQVRIQRDLEIASQIQSSLLPMQDPELSGFEIVSYSRPANEVGGDFYHYVNFDDDNQIGLVVGDVSGKGVPAALFMAVAISTLRAQAPHYYQDSAALLTAVNKILYPQMSISYVNTAMLYATIEKYSGGKALLTVSNAGLIWPLLRRSNGHTEYVHISGFPIGTMPDAHYQSLQLQLRSGDVVILSSDGLVEAMNSRKELFGFERLKQCLADCDDCLSASDLLKHVKENVFAFMGKAEPHDDKRSNLDNTNTIK